MLGTPGVRPSAPGSQLGIAFVARHDRAVLAGPGHDLGQVLGAQHPPGRVARGVDPDQLDPRRQRPELGRAVGRHRLRAGQPGADVVRRVGHLRVDDEVARPQPEQRRQQRRPAPCCRSSAARRPGRRPARPGAGRTTPRRPPAGPACRRSADSPAHRRPRRARPGPARAWGRPAYRPRGRRCRPRAPGPSRRTAPGCPTGSPAAPCARSLIGIVATRRAPAAGARR